MNLKNKKVFLTRPYKVVYKDGDRIIKVFTKEHGKANVFNEALCQARVEESGLDIPKVLEVTEIDGEWAVVIEFRGGKNSGGADERASGEPGDLHGAVCGSAACHA